MGFKGWVPRFCPKGLVQRLGLKVMFQGWVPNLSPKVGSQDFEDMVTLLGQKDGDYGLVQRLVPKVGS